MFAFKTIENTIDIACLTAPSPLAQTRTSYFIFCADNTSVNGVYYNLPG